MLSPQLNNMPSASPNLDFNASPFFTPCTTTDPVPEQCYNISPFIYRHHLETDHTSDQHAHFRHGGTDVQAPARAERGLTGHGSVVNGSAHT
jgi:hypothetical protein